MPLTVIATITAKPGSEETIKAGLIALVGPSRQDDGCLSYDLFQSAGDPAVFMTYEQWESEAHLEAHMQSPHLAKAAQELGAELAKPFEVVPLNAVAV